MGRGGTGGTGGTGDTGGTGGDTGGTGGTGDTGGIGGTGGGVSKSGVQLGASFVKAQLGNVVFAANAGVERVVPCQ